MPYSAEGNWQAADLFDVIRRLLDDHPAMSEAEKVMAHALIDAHASQYVANTLLFHATRAIHGGLLGIPAGSPADKKALREQGY